MSRSLGRKGNVLYELARRQAPDLDEAGFVDSVSRHLACGEFLLLIIGDGIREGVENIVDFVQRYSGLHFSLALVEAALYRDTVDRIVVQPRCLARTQVVQRLVFGEASEPPESETDDEPLSERQEENVRFWSAVLRDYAFTDPTVDVPSVVPKESSLFVTVNWGLWFSGYLYRRNSIGCYLTCRKGTSQAEQVFEELKSELDGLKTDLGNDLTHWENKHGRPRIGFFRDTNLPFDPTGDADSFDDAVLWMRDRLDRLVSTLSPLLRRMLRGN